MTLFITHVGRIMLEHVPISFITKGAPQYVEVRKSPNRYSSVIVGLDGIVLFNRVVAGFVGSKYTLREARDLAFKHDMEIVGVVDYREISN